MLIFFSFHLISSHRSFSWKLLTASHCHRSPCLPISSQLISCLLNFFHLMSALRSSCFLSHSQLFSADHDSSFLFSCHLSLSHLFSSQFLSTFLRFSSSQLFSALILRLLISSFLFSHLPSSSHTSSVDPRSCQLVTPHITALLSALSNHLHSPLAENLLQKRISAPKQATPTLSTEKV